MTFHLNTSRTLLSLITISLSASQAFAQASPQTAAHNAQVLKQLPFDNTQDFNSAHRGFIAKPDTLIIKDPTGKIVWDIGKFTQFEKPQSDAPDTVNPSLWRQSLLNNDYGLFKVTDSIYQIRGYDLSVMTIIQGKTGLIIVDPLTSMETAQAAMQLVRKNLSTHAVKAVIYTHSHIDHFGGVKGVVSESDVKAGKVKIIAPKGFMDAAVSENVMAGNAMTRRASYMYGMFLPASAKGAVDAGLGKATSQGTITLIPPTDIIGETGKKMTVDGVDFVFQYAPDSEAPSEMLFYLPQFHALCAAEDATHTLHNLYTLRGAKVRNAKKWAEYLSETLALFGKQTKVVFASHHWPTWGHEQVIDYLEKQRDTYKYIHDQTLRLANQGYTMVEAADNIQLPNSLSQEWYNRGYYGSVNHNVKAVYQSYIGWFDGNPAHLYPLSNIDASKKMVEYMGGEEALLKKANKDYANGQYRWVAQAVNYIVYANPNNQEAKDLQAKTLEQLGYQTENATWRNFYLSGAKELKHGIDRSLTGTSASADIIAALPLEMFFDFLAVKLNGPKAAGKEIQINWSFPDTNQHYVLSLKNAVLHFERNKTSRSAEATVTLKRQTLNHLLTGNKKLSDAIENGDIKVSGQTDKVKELFSLFDSFDRYFGLVLPRPAG